MSVCPTDLWKTPRRRTVSWHDLDMTAESRAFVFAPSPLLTVTIEAASDGGTELHVHAGGQGFWIARMAVSLGLKVTLCGVFGGETGAILHDIVKGEGIDVRAIETSGENGSYVHDRRGGEREHLADVTPAVLTRHEVDDLFGVSLTEVIGTGAPTRMT